MQDRADFAKAQAKALELLQQFGPDNPPIDPEEIAESIGVEVVYADFEGDFAEKVSGFYDAQEKRIYVNKQEHANRKTFTIAHELGHHILHQEYVRSEKYRYMPRYATYDRTKPKEEKEADAFAANLLVPVSMLKRYSDIASDTELATLFGVSPAVISFRRRWL